MCRIFFVESSCLALPFFFFFSLVYPFLRCNTDLLSFHEMFGLLFLWVDLKLKSLVLDVTMKCVWPI